MSKHKLYWNGKELPAVDESGKAISIRFFSVDGEIFAANLDDFKAADADPEVKSIIISIDSPGSKI
ncbi:hypothetical protein [Mucilaginibacter sp.]